MPPVWETYREHRELLLGARTVVVRLHGPDREGIEEETGKSWNRLVVRRDDELGAIVGMTRELLDAGANVYLNVNNHYEGSAPLTIEGIEGLLGLASPGRRDEGPARPGDPTLPGME
jgi:hypothetical protein